MRAQVLFGFFDAGPAEAVQTVGPAKIGSSVESASTVGGHTPPENFEI